MRIEARWSLVLALGALSLAATLTPGALEALRWERESMGGGQWGRLLSGHFVHLDERHLLLNMAGLVLVAEWLLEHWRAADLVSVLSASALGTSMLLWLLEPGLHWYAGLSGALHGLWAGAALLGWQQWRRPVFAAALAALTVKLAFFNGGSATMPVVPVAHGYGAASGLGWALIQSARRPAQDHFD